MAHTNLQTIITTNSTVNEQVLLDYCLYAFILRANNSSIDRITNNRKEIVDLYKMLVKEFPKIDDLLSSFPRRLL